MWKKRDHPTFINTNILNSTRFVANRFANRGSNNAKICLANNKSTSRNRIGGRSVPSKVFMERKTSIIQSNTGKSDSKGEADRNMPALASAHSVINLMRQVEEAMWNDKNSPQTETLLGTFKEELDRNLFYPPQRTGKRERQPSKPLRNVAKKRIRIAEHSDVRGFLEMMQGTREYNWKTKAAIQHRPTESPWFQSILPKNKPATTKVIIVPEVDTSDEIVDSFVEKELKRCGGVPNVIKASKKNFTTEKLKLHYEKSAMETYSPIGNERDSTVNDLILKLGLPHTMDVTKRSGMTLSATDLTAGRKIKNLRNFMNTKLTPPDTPCTPMTERQFDIYTLPKKKKYSKGNKKKSPLNNKKGKGKDIEPGGNKIVLEALKKQVRLSETEIPIRADGSLTELNFDKEPTTCVTNIRESSTESLNQNKVGTESCSQGELKMNNENSTVPISQGQSKKKVNITEVIATLERVKDVLENLPPELEDDDSTLVQDVKDQLLQKFCSSKTDENSEEQKEEIREKLKDLIEEANAKVSKGKLLEENINIQNSINTKEKESETNKCEPSMSSETESNEELKSEEKTKLCVSSFSLSFPWDKRVFISPKTGRLVGYSKRERLLTRCHISLKCATVLQNVAVWYSLDVSYSAASISEDNQNCKTKKSCNLSRTLKKILSKTSINDLPNKVTNFLRGFSINTIHGPRRVSSDEVFDLSSRVEEPSYQIHHSQIVPLKTTNNLVSSENRKLHEYIHLAEDPLKNKLNKEKGSNEFKSIFYPFLKENNSKELMPFDPVSLFNFTYKNFIATQKELHTSIGKLIQITGIKEDLLLKFIKIVCKKDVNYKETIFGQIKDLIDLAASYHNLQTDLENIFTDKIQQIFTLSEYTCFEKDLDNLKYYLENNLMQKLQNRINSSQSNDHENSTGKMMKLIDKSKVEDPIRQNSAFKCLYIVGSVVFLFSTILLIPFICA